MKTRSRTIPGYDSDSRGARMTWLSFAIVMTLALLFFPGASFGMIVGGSFPVAATSGDELLPAVSGDLAVWEDRGGADAEIRGKNLSTNTELSLPAIPGDQFRPDIDGDIVVWEDHRKGTGEADIHGYDLGRNQPLTISDTAADQRRPSISGDTVVWEENTASGWKLYGYDLNSGERFVVSESAGDKRRSDVSGDTVVWENHLGAGNSDVYGKRLASGEEFVVTESAAYEDTPQVSGSTVVWRENGPGNDDVYAKDLETGERFEVCVDAADQRSPKVSGKLVVWVDGRGGDADVYGKDLQSGEEFLVSGEESPEESPAVSGETVVWEAQRTGQTNFGDWDVLGTSVDAAPSRPEDLVANGTSGGVELSWKANSERDLAGYDVYRSSSPDGPFQKLNDSPVKSSGYSDSNAPKGELSHYRLFALDARGQQSAFASTSGAALSETSLTLDASRVEIQFGSSLELSGRLARQGASGSEAVSGEEISLESATPGSGDFRTLSRKSVSSDGSFRFQNVAPASDAEYRVRFEGNSSRGLQSSTSNVVSVRVIRTTEITATLSPGVVPFGRATGVSGRLTSPSGGVGGRTVILDAAPFGGSGFAEAARASTSANGSYAFGGLRPKKHTRYRARFAGEGGFQPSVSRISQARVRAVVSTNLSASRVRPGRPVVVAGMVSPAHAGRVVVTVRGNGRVVSERRVLLSATGSAPLSGSRYRFAYTPRRAGNYSVQVRFAGDADHLGASGAVRYFVVR